MEQVFVTPFRVSPKESSILPAGTTFAFLRCYTYAADYEEAVRKCLSALASDGMHVEEILQPIQSMRSSDWAQHIAEQWPDHASMLPDQKAFESSLLRGGVVYGPIAGG